MDPSQYVPAVFPLVNFVLIVGGFSAIVFFGTRKIDAKVEEIVVRLQHAAEHDDRREAQFSKVVGGFDQVVKDFRRTADACEKACAGVLTAADVSRKSLDTAKAMQATSNRMADMVEQLARDFMKATAPVAEEKKATC